MTDSNWLSENLETEETEDFDIDEYDLTANPNDFNVLTISSFIASGAVKIPGFQRNYVWDIKRASKLIESLLLGLPVPQVFLYEESRNQFLVIDGQQRLMSVYYFTRGRFPRKEKRVELRRLFTEKPQFPDEVLDDDDFFQPFRLSLPERPAGKQNRFKGLKYSTLGDYRTQFDLRTVRNVIVKQTSPSGDDSSVFEIFNRLNTGGINLRPQEIRSSLYHSNFYDMLQKLNLEPRWRSLLGLPDPDLHMKDVEVILRGFAMLIDGDNYSPSMSKFLNRFSKSGRGFGMDDVSYLSSLFSSFLAATEAWPTEVLFSSRTHRFSLALFEAVFTALCLASFRNRDLLTRRVDHQLIRRLDSDTEFIEAAEKSTADTSNVATRLRRAKEIILR